MTDAIAKPVEILLITGPARGSEEPAPAARDASQLNLPAFWAPIAPPATAA